MPASPGTGSGGLLEDHVAIIGGGTSGIGETAARRFAREGAKVAIHFSGSTANSVAKADRIVDELTKAGYEAMSVRADVTKYEDVKSSVDSVVARWGKVSSVVDFAGLPSSLAFWQEDPLGLSDEDLLSAINIDFIGSYHFIRAVREHMRNERYGKIVLISSSPTIYGDDAGYRYVLSKDLNRMTVKSLAMKLVREDGIALNAIAPGTIDTPANRVNYTEEGWKELVGAIPIGRAGLPDEIAGVALFLCSHLSDFVVGQTIIADGGEIRQ
ncbi:MAG: SDR family oxidoreductase [Nitrososphaerales archaeon]|jgi:3-oxoacyl-[acyl-carrier protein] reductase